MNKILAICNQKGGTGKTTSAINIATYLALTGKRVLVVDLDPQANATSGLGINKHNIKKSTYHILLEELDIREILQDIEVNNLYLAPSNLDLTGAEVELVSTLGREYRLKRALELVKDNFDFILIDSPPSLGLLTINALCAADAVLIPVQCEYYALEGLTQLVNTIKLVKDHLNPNLEIQGVILTMADFRTNLTKEVIQESRQHFKDKIYATVIPRSIKLSEAPSYGKPIALYDKHCIGAQKYEELTREILNTLYPENTVEQQELTNPVHMEQISDPINKGE